MRTSIKTSKTLKLAAIAVLGACLPLAGHAGTVVDKNPVAPPPPPEEPFVTGNVTVNYETHFISYGQDVWAAGTSWSDSLIHPSIELDFNLAKGLQFYLNLWGDVNDDAESNIGKYVQEIDVNVGFYYTMDKLKFQLGYGAWNYASQTESVIEGRVTFLDGFWSPFVAIHGRPDIGSNIGLDTGVVGQLGIAPSKTWGALTLALPVTVSFDSDGFHGGDAGFAYVSAGLGATYAISKHVALNLGVTYYHTNDSVIPVNPKSDFVTGLAGFTVSF